MLAEDYKTVPHSPDPGCARAYDESFAAGTTAIDQVVLAATDRQMVAEEAPVVPETGYVVGSVRVIVIVGLEKHPEAIVVQYHIYDLGHSHSVSAVSVLALLVPAMTDRVRLARVKDYVLGHW